MTADEPWSSQRSKQNASRFVKAKENKLNELKMQINFEFFAPNEVYK